MKNITVRTAGQFMLIDRFSGKEILPDQDNKVPFTDFIRERLASKELTTEDDVSALVDDPEELENPTDDHETETELDETLPVEELEETPPADDHETETELDETLPVEELEETTPAAKPDPLDHDADGKKGGSKPRAKRS